MLTTTDIKRPYWPETEKELIDSLVLASEEKGGYTTKEVRQSLGRELAVTL